jgi:hypothetical protein
MIRFLDEYPSESGGRLGRHVGHDPRSRAYAVSEDLLPGSYASAVHQVRIPVLDQGDLGSCTGNAAEKVVLARNSWGPSWGAQGTFRVSWDDLGRLLDEDGDATLFVPLSAPAPTPNPPTPADVDKALATAIRGRRPAEDAWLTA